MKRSDKSMILNEKEYEMRVLEIGLKVGYYRRKAGMTQAEAAEAVGVTTAHYAEIEAPNMVRCPSIKLLLNLEKTFGVPAYKFLQTDED